MSDALEAAVAAAVALERARVVAWLRARARHHEAMHAAGVVAMCHRSAALSCLAKAQGIEDGEHAR